MVFVCRKCKKAVSHTWGGLCVRHREGTVPPHSHKKQAQAWEAMCDKLATDYNVASEQWAQEKHELEAMCEKLAGELEKFEKAEQFRADGKANEWAKAIDEIDSYEALAEYKAMKGGE